ncbi:MAG: multidrug efflux SMR transporter [Eggerthellaceae bacterium]|nr:multidrug efflux SMR transporter [Eggerthellaceae bacterium]
MPYLLLGVAIIGEVCGTTCMKLSNGFKKLLPTIGLAVAYIIAFGALGIAMLDIPLGVVYGLWAGAGTALTAIVGAIIWKEGFSSKKIAGIILIIVGVVVLEMGIH